ncbi:MAG: hypothetical protein U5R49_06655 [Deltaproteobacteria bacterium]|nr:hypothetical protein [Deltaproteobacteria bacterium]
MVFNSLTFGIFLPIVFLAYWLICKSKASLQVQNAFLLVASYVFYGWWDYRFLTLIVISSFVDFRTGLLLFKTKSIARRKYLLSFSIAVNLGILCFFKYFNFFVESFATLLETMGFSANPMSLKVILPVGISFYTFQSMSYSIDIYRRKITPVSNPIQYFSFVSFFPQLVAGPIERATNLLPQFGKNRIFNVDDAKLESPKFCGGHAAMASSSARIFARFGQIIL